MEKEIKCAECGSKNVYTTEKHGKTCRKCGWKEKKDETRD